MNMMLNLTGLVEDANMESLVRSIATTVHTALGGGFDESCYDKALVIEARNRGVCAETQRQFPVFYKNEIITYLKPSIVLTAGGEQAVLGGNGHEPQLLRHLLFFVQVKHFF
jgi:hypothetical protein